MFSQYENVIEKDDGVYIRAGKFAGTYKNFCYLIENTETKEKYYKMTCNPDNTKCTILSIEDMKLIKNIVKGICLLGLVALFCYSCETNPTSTDSETSTDGSVGTSASTMVRFAANLSPMAAMA